MRGLCSGKELEVAKKKLMELIGFINSEDFYGLSDGDKQNVHGLRVGMEIYVNSMSNLLFVVKDFPTQPNFMMPLLLSMFMGASPFGPGSGSDFPKKEPSSPEHAEHNDNAEEQGAPADCQQG